MTEVPPRLTLEDAQIIYRNFSGNPTPLNPLGGKRTFNVIVGMDQVDELRDLGWNVKVREPKEEDDEPFAHLPCEVRYDNKPPMVTVVTESGETILDDSTIQMLDFADITKVDITLNPYYWETAVGAGIKAYVKTMYVHVDEDVLQRKYSKSKKPAAREAPPEDD